MNESGLPVESNPESARENATITVVPKQWRFEARPSESILDAARRAGIGFPKSCRNGTCRSCLCRLVTGNIRYRIDWPGVTREEKEEGLILPCVAVAEGDVVVEVPSARLLSAPGA